jgi:large subunit ribosomal protein L15
MSLSNLEQVVHKKKKRLGRGAGSAKGQKSGRGTTRHQGARTTIPLHFEGGQGRIVKKFPLLRGKMKNKSYKSKSFIVTLTMLEQFDGKETITIETLVKQNLVKKNIPVKVVSNGTLTKPLTIALPVSKSARATIEKAGGKVQ